MSWFRGEKEIKQSNFFKMSTFDNTCQLEITRVYSEDEGEYTCVARNAGGMVTCSAHLKLDGEFAYLSVTRWLPIPGIDSDSTLAYSYTGVGQASCLD